MRVKFKWFLTGNVSTINEDDSLVGPQTTILELKGLLQIRYTYPARDMLMLLDHLLENDVRLRDVGINSSEDADDKPILVHIVDTRSKLEGSHVTGGGEDEDEEAEEEGGDDDESISGFSHEDFQLACKMLGKRVPVPVTRVQELRQEPPRFRPKFLDLVQPSNPPDSNKIVVSSESSSSGSGGSGGGGSAAAGGEGGGGDTRDKDDLPPVNRNDPNYQHKSSQIHIIFACMDYGLRREDAESRFEIKGMTGSAEPYQFWDMRLPENRRYQVDFCAKYEVCFELFFLGDFAPLESESGGEQFSALVRRKLESTMSIKPRTPVPPREAGCMYPLVAVAVVMTEVEGMELGNAVFEDFGKPQEMPGHHPQKGGGAGPGKPSRGGGGCGAQ